MRGLVYGTGEKYDPVHGSGYLVYGIVEVHRRTRNQGFGVRDKNRHLPTPCLERWGHREVDAARGGDGSLDGFVTLFCEADLCA